MNNASTVYMVDKLEAYLRGPGIEYPPKPTFVDSGPYAKVIYNAVIDWDRHRKTTGQDPLEFKKRLAMVCAEYAQTFIDIHPLNIILLQNIYDFVFLGTQLPAVVFYNEKVDDPEQRVKFWTQLADGGNLKDPKYAELYNSPKFQAVENLRQVVKAAGDTTDCSSDMIEQIKSAIGAAQSAQQT